MTPLGIAIFAGVAALLLWGMARRPDAVSFTVAGFFIASLPLDWLVEHGRVIPFLSALDACMVVAMCVIWTRHHSHRARLVGTIGLAKCAWALWAYDFPHVDFYSYATALNAAFVAQVFVAGGFLDAVGRWIADMPRRIGHGRVVHFRHVGG